MTTDIREIDEVIAEALALIDYYLRARTAGTGIAHCPEVIFLSHANYAL